MAKGRMMRADDPKLNGLIASVHVSHVEDTGVAVCVMTLRSGQKVVGYAISHADDDDARESGATRAKEVCRRRIASLETYCERKEAQSNG